MALTEALKSRTPRWAVPFARKVYHTSYRVLLKARFVASDVLGRKPWGEPLPPAHLRFRVSESIDPNTFLSHGSAAAQYLQNALQSIHRPIEDNTSVLEFGCGCGRVLVPLSRQFSRTHFVGTDVDNEAIKWCARHFPAMEFAANQELPPLPFDPAAFDLIYCISVFTHLDDAHTRAWLSELKRVLKPSGTLLLTVHGEHVWHQLSPAQQQQVRQAGFLFEETEKLKGIQPDWYQTSYHGSGYILGVVSEHFEILAHLPQGMGYQDVIVAGYPK